MNDCNCDDDMTEDGHSTACPNSIGARLAAAREEQREACARHIREEFLADLDIDADSACLNTPLTSTPLGDRLDALERDVRVWRLESAALRTQKEQAEAERDALRAQVDAARAVCVNTMALGDDDVRPADVLRAMDEAKP